MFIPLSGVLPYLIKRSSLREAKNESMEKLTFLEFFEKMPPAIGDKCKRNFLAEGFVSAGLKPLGDSPENYVSQAFKWRNTPEGRKYWYYINLQLRQGVPVEDLSELKMVGKLVTVTLTTRVEVREDADDREVLEAAKAGLLDKLTTDLEENVESIVLD